MKKQSGYLAILLLAGMLSACGTGGREEASFEVKYLDRTNQIIEKEDGKKNGFAAIEEYLKDGKVRIFSFRELEVLQEECGAVLLGELPEMEGFIYGYVGAEKEYQGIWIQDKEGQRFSTVEKRLLPHHWMAWMEKFRM